VLHVPAWLGMEASVNFPRGSVPQSTAIARARGDDRIFDQTIVDRAPEIDSSSSRAWLRFRDRRPPTNTNQARVSGSGAQKPRNSATARLTQPADITSNASTWPRAPVRPDSGARLPGSTTATARSRHLRTRAMGTASALPL